MRLQAMGDSPLLLAARIGKTKAERVQVPLGTGPFIVENINISRNTTMIIFHVALADTDLSNEVFDQIVDKSITLVVLNLDDPKYAKLVQDADEDAEDAEEAMQNTANVT